MSASQRSDKAPRRLQSPFVLFNGDVFKNVVALLLILIAVITGIINFIIQDEELQLEVAAREMQRYAIEAVSQQTVGEIRADFAWMEIYRLWLELDILSYYAYLREDDALEAIYTDARTQTESFSPLLREPYFRFDPAANFVEPKVTAYESDLYVPRAKLLAEQYQNMSGLNQEYDNRLDTYELYKSLLTLALILLGLDVTLVRNTFMKWALLALALGMTVYASLGAYQVNAAPLSSIPQAAMERYAEGYGYQHQGRYDEAIAHYNEALALQPDYMAVIMERGFARREAFAQNPDPAYLAPATADFETALAAGQDHIDITGYLGELYYLQGRFEDAIAIAQRSIAANGAFLNHFDLGRNLLAKGDLEAARKAYERGIQQAHAEVTGRRAQGGEPPEFTWVAFGFAKGELYRMIGCLADAICEETPPLTAFSDNVRAETLATARHLLERLYEVETGLEIMNALPSNEPADEIQVEVSNVRFLGLDEDGTVLEDKGIIHSLTPRVQLTFDYEVVSGDNAFGGEPPLFVQKLLYEGNEYTPLRVVRPWDGGTSGTYQRDITPGVELGDFTLQIYLDGHLILEDSFTQVFGEIDGNGDFYDD